VAERELSPSQKAAIYIELGMLEEDHKNTPNRGRPKKAAPPREFSGEAIETAARKAGVGEHTMRDVEWLSKNAPDEYEAARAHPPIWPTKPSAER